MYIVFFLCVLISCVVLQESTDIEKAVSIEEKPSVETRDTWSYHASSEVSFILMNTKYFIEILASILTFLCRLLKDQRAVLVVIICLQHPLLMNNA